MEGEDKTKGRLLWLMCDKCSRLGEFSCSLEQVIMQESLLAQPQLGFGVGLLRLVQINGVDYTLNLLS